MDIVELPLSKADTQGERAAKERSVFAPFELQAAGCKLQASTSFSKHDKTRYSLTLTLRFDK